MDAKEIFKKFWFVGLVAILFVAFIIVYIVQTIENQPVVKEPLEKDGQYIIYSINGEDYTADEFYEDLKETYGDTTIYNRLERYVMDKAVATTEEMRTIASSNAAYLLEQYGEEELTSQMKALGYDEASDAYDYYIYLQKSIQVRTDYLKEHYDDIVAPFMEENHPKMISHILVTVEDIEEVEDEDGNTTYVANPTDEEQAKLDAILEALSNGESFADVAAEYSDDSSASNGGSLGYFDDNNTTYVDIFKETAKTVSEGETSEVITSEYGYHIIYCDSESFDVLIEDTDFLNAIYNEHDDAYYAPLLNLIEEYSISVSDDEIWNSLLEQLNPSNDEQTADEESTDDTSTDDTTSDDSTDESEGE